MIHRNIEAKLRQLSEKFPIVTVTGPRQSGKSTLLKNLYPDYRYVSLENPDMRRFASEDPNGFIKTYNSHVIIDEAERVPDLFSYLQTHVDNVNESGMYLLAGSRNFHLMAAIDQSLAGRTAVLKLLPFSRRELHEADLLPKEINEQIFKGFYPRIYDKNIAPTDYYPAYISTYVERDVRVILNIGDLSRFTRFVRLCAGRIGQLLNKANLATETGVTIPTIESWLSVLEASYIIYRLEPNFNNYNKRIVKTPKLFFYDTGLACNLLGISSPQQLDSHFLRGALFENMVVNQFLKDNLNRGVTPDLTFWRDSTGLEVDLIETKGLEQYAYEIKSGSTFNQSFFDGLNKWGVLSATPENRRSVIYTGDETLSTSLGSVLSFNSLC
ncbi:MAG: ATP-binding protein [Bacteroides sp.]|nr:ATP-binding protein [Bacteroides sp.]MCM1379878.1 ATP-binding protein [Bacteroides sp.]MCM1446090.1 ATP-binding protein [Prevotella sp.]